MVVGLLLVGVEVDGLEFGHAQLGETFVGVVEILVLLVRQLPEVDRAFGDATVGALEVVEQGQSEFGVVANRSLRLESLGAHVAVLEDVFGNDVLDLLALVVDAGVVSRGKVGSRYLSLGVELLPLAADRAVESQRLGVVAGDALLFAVFDEAFFAESRAGTQDLSVFEVV